MEDKFDLESLGGYNQDDPEYWLIMAKSIGNPIPDITKKELEDETGE